LPRPVWPKKIKKTSQTLLRLFRDPHRSRPPTQRTQTAGTSGRLAQLVERLVYTEDVGGSSPSSPTIFPFFIFILLRWFGALARRLRAACPCAEAHAAPSPCLRFARQTSPRGERGSTGAVLLSHLLLVTGRISGPTPYARERIAGEAAFPFSPRGEGAGRRMRGRPGVSRQSASPRHTPLDTLPYLWQKRARTRLPLSLERGRAAD
jgi:hypothetical protein